ncbi:glycosyltransferase family 2 protein [Actibacterium lipolyticum]|uniref:Putative glycosyl transferase n=1 Tax=Actibacterium lipolyticum TaxID=1524263 RepID=A0A238KPH1_9RHOB|nr:glycosyltransferase [Actibacterium lipolyticum]SMX44723.1 putative glycosyl transferase [Actibacterium lipolyticum]
MAPSIALIIPVYNGGDVFKECVKAINAQTFDFTQKIVIDSSSTDGSGDVARANGFDVITIPKSTFDHGGARNTALKSVDADIVVMMTQDAILDRADSVAQLTSALMQEGVVAAFGRQLPHNDADPLAQFTRSQNYPPASYVTAKDDSHPAGFRKCFLSNSFAAYRVPALQEIGGFPERLIMGEDSYAAACFLNRGMKVAYVAEATVRHSHNYSIAEEFQRYFDIGVFHTSQHWMLDDFGTVHGEGRKFAMAQIRYLWANGTPFLIPKSIAASASKLIGYKLGRKHDQLGARLSRRLAMQKEYFRGS